MKSIATVIVATTFFVSYLLAHGSQAAGHDQKLTLGQPVHIGAITVIPIDAKAPPMPGKYLTLAQATELGSIDIIEQPGNEQVNSLQVRNRSKLPILLFAGELLLGGKQDRIVGKDTIVPALETLDVPVYCVEHGRWEGKPGGAFKGGDTFVPQTVRSAASAPQSGPNSVGRNQSEVWSKVAVVNADASAAPMTGTIRGALDDPKIRAKAEAITAKLTKTLGESRQTIGVICWIDGHIQSADLFGNHDVFMNSREKLFRSYAYDVQLHPSAKDVPLDLDACKKFLDDILGSRRELRDKNGRDATYGVDGKVKGYEFGAGGFGGGAGRGGFGHGNYIPK